VRNTDNVEDVIREKKTKITYPSHTPVDKRKERKKARTKHKPGKYQTTLQKRNKVPRPPHTHPTQLRQGIKVEGRGEEMKKKSPCHIIA